MIILEVNYDNKIEELFKLFDDGPIRKYLREIEHEFLWKLCSEYLETLKEGILNNEAGGPGLKDSTIAKKGHSIKWLDEHDMYNSFAIVEMPEHMFAGVPINAKNRKGQPLHLVAFWMEIGTKKMPARPLFEPMAEKLNNNEENRKYLNELALKKFDEHAKRFLKSN